MRTQNTADRLDEIMILADTHAYARVKDGTPAEQLPRNLLERRMQQIVSHVFGQDCELTAARLEIASLQAQAQQCGAGAGCCAQAARIAELEAQLDAGAGGVGAVGEMRASESLGVAPYADIWGWLQPGTKLYSATQVQAMLAAQAQPVATIYVTEDGSREVDDWKVELPVGATTLYTAAQAQEDAKDAARYRWLRINAIGAFRTNDGKGPVSVYHLSKIPAIPGIPEETDAAIDAAIAAQQGEKHE